MIKIPEGTHSVLIFWTADYMELWEHKVISETLGAQHIWDKIQEEMKKETWYTLVKVSYWDQVGNELDSQSFWRSEVFK